MGRRAKYLTAETKRDARYAQAQAYRRTEKGKAARRRDNQRQSERKQARELTWAGVQVPLALYNRSRNILRASFAVQDSGPLLGLWTSPYRFAMPDVRSLPTVNNTRSSAWTSQVAVLGAYQYGEVIEAGWRRFEEWTADGVLLDEIEGKVKQEVAERVDAWVYSADAMSKDGRNGEVMAVGLDWGAKIIRMLVEEWEIRKNKGETGYREHRKGSRLPWQIMMKETMCLFNQEMN